MQDRSELVLLCSICPHIWGFRCEDAIKRPVQGCAGGEPAESWKRCLPRQAARWRRTRSWDSGSRCRGLQRCKQLCLVCCSQITRAKSALHASSLQHDSILHKPNCISLCEAAPPYAPLRTRVLKPAETGRSPVARRSACLVGVWYPPLALRLGCKFLGGEFSFGGRRNFPSHAT